MDQRKRQILLEFETTKVIAVWKSFIRVRRGCKRNSLVLLSKMCEKLEVVHSLKLTSTELKTIINSLIKKFRSEKKKISLSGGSPSDWVHYKEINSCFVLSQRLYRPYLEFNRQKRKRRPLKIYFFELASQEVTNFKKYCAQTLELMAPSYFVALNQTGQE